MRPTTVVVATLLVLSVWTLAAAETADARIVVKGVRLADNGDDDGFADPNETVSLYVTLRNVSGSDREGIVLGLSSTGQHVDCVPTSVVSFGSLAAGETREAAVPLTIRVSNVSRTSVTAEMTVDFEVLVWGGDFDVLSDPQRIVLDLDLDVSGGGSATTFTEGFEGTTFGSFTTMSLDLNRATYDRSSGLRCQNHQCTTGSCSEWQFCYVGFANAANNAFDWHIHGPSSPDGGRAYLGSQSLHWGMHPGPAAMDTTRLKQLDALRTTDPIDLGWSGPPSELTFKHQVGLSDCDFLNCEHPLTVDRGVVHVQLASSSGTGVGQWRKLYPYENLYDSQVTDLYSNCIFDPMDDGSNEFDLYLPTPIGQKPSGPSSTCAPEFSFSRQGAIGYDTVFDPAAIGRATDGPGLPGSLGPGTWVESKFRLDRWRGRRIRLRFLATTVEVVDALSWQQSLEWNPTEADDGWYIDDLQVTNTLTAPATVTVDTADRSDLPACVGSCSGVTAVLTASPDTPGAPGENVLLDASGSTLGACPGPLLFRFSEDVNLNGTLWHPFFDGWDRVLRPWTEALTLDVTPGYSTRYAVEVRCPALPGCGGLDFADVTVPCPESPTPFPESVRFVNQFFLAWDTQRVVDVLAGDLAALHAGGHAAAVLSCIFEDESLDGFGIGDPPPGVGWYFLVRAGGYAPACVRSWSTGSPAEEVGAGTGRDLDIPVDPDGCD